MSIKYKMFSGFFIVVLILAIAGGWSIYKLSDVGENVQLILEENYKSIKVAKNMKDALERQDSGMLLCFLGRKNEGLEIIDKADTAFQTAFSVAENNITIDGEAELISKIQSHYNGYIAELRNSFAFEQTANGNVPDSIKISSIQQAFYKTMKGVDGLLEMNNDALYKSAITISSTSQNAIVPVIIAVAGSAVLALIFSFFVNEYVAKPIQQINQGIRNFYLKRMTYRVEINTRDEIHELNDAVLDLCTELEQGHDK